MKSLRGAIWQQDAIGQGKFRGESISAESLNNRFRSRLGLGPVQRTNWSALLSDVREGKLRSEQTLWQAIRPTVRRAAREVLGKHSYLLEECEQIVMSKVLEHLSTFGGRGSLKAWVRSIATNAAMDLLRTEGIIQRSTRCRASRSFVSLDTSEEGAHILRLLEAFDDGGRAESRATYTHLMSRVLLALRDMPIAWGQAFQLYSRGLQHSEIAEQLGITAEYSRKLVQRATDRLQMTIRIRAIPRSDVKASVSLEFDLDQVIEKLVSSRGIAPWAVRPMCFESLSQKVGAYQIPEPGMNCYELSEVKCNDCGICYNVRHVQHEARYTPSCCHYCESACVSVTRTICGFTSETEVFTVGPPKQKRYRTRHPRVTTDNAISNVPAAMDKDDDVIPMPEPQIVECGGKKHERVYFYNADQVGTYLVDLSAPRLF